MNPRFEELRALIVANDERIVGLVNERLRLVTALWQLKRELGLAQIDSGREQRLRAALSAANGGPLSAEGLDGLVTELLALTKRELGPF